MTDERLEKLIDKLDARLHTVERLVWIAVGGVTVTAGLVTFGLNYLSGKLA